MLARLIAGVDKKGAPSDPEKAMKYAREAFNRSGKRGYLYLSFVARCQALSGDPKSAAKTMRTVVKLADEEVRESYIKQLGEYLKKARN